ncbi:hypothetical protein CARUB_v10022481mg [Capsella rubella]|uniref:Uncharacterized protein n=2 Tax=Capsella rubella TaxID=81985 RepID=R0GGP6_9BRAS|nr:hypothetical protein CARUB_v10022481mg [Capsella rubella]
MHKLLQQVGRQEIKRQEPWKRHILIDPHEICDVLQSNKGTRTVKGISFDISEIDEVIISERAFKSMRNLRFLSVYKARYDEIDRVDIPEEMEFPPSLRLLHWEAYPKKSLTSSFNPKNLVELNMDSNKFMKLWEGTQPLTNLKKMSLVLSKNLKVLPDLSNATNLEQLNLSGCTSLVEIPSSFSNLHKLDDLAMMFCENLEVIPADMNLASINSINLVGCSRLRNIPFMSTKRYGSDTKLEEGNWSLKTSTQVMRFGLHLNDCKKLESLPEFSSEFMFINADCCESLKRVPHRFNCKYAHLNFSYCFKLSQEARRSIIQRSFYGPRDFVNGYACLPERELPEEFNHRAKGNCLTIRCQGNKPLYAFATFRVCLVLSPHREPQECTIPSIMCRRISKDGLYPVDDTQFYNDAYPSLSGLATEHLFVFLSDMDQEDKSLEVTSEIQFEFSCSSPYIEIVECGAQIRTEETVRSKKGAKRINFRSCIILCIILVTVVLIPCFNLSSL